VSKRNLMLFIRPTIIRDRDEYRQASSGQYTAFNDAQTKQRGKEQRSVAQQRSAAHLPQQETQAFRQVSAAIDAFNLGGRL
jgi:general secretion pathway protein D